MWNNCHILTLTSCIIVLSGSKLQNRDQYYLTRSCVPCECLWFLSLLPYWKGYSFMFLCLILNVYFLAGVGQHDGWSHDQRKWGVFWHRQIQRAWRNDSWVFWAIFMAIWEERDRENCWAREVRLQLCACCFVCCEFCKHFHVLNFTVICVIQYNTEICIIC